MDVSPKDVVTVSLHSLESTYVSFDLRQNVLLPNQQQSSTYRQRRYQHGLPSEPLEERRQRGWLRGTVESLTLDQRFLLLRCQNNMADFSQNLQSGPLPRLQGTTHVAAPSGGGLSAGPVDPVKPKTPLNRHKACCLCFYIQISTFRITITGRSQ